MGAIRSSLQLKMEKGVAPPHLEEKIKRNILNPELELSQRVQKKL